GGRPGPARSRGGAAERVAFAGRPPPEDVRGELCARRLRVRARQRRPRRRAPDRERRPVGRAHRRRRPRGVRQLRRRRCLRGGEPAGHRQDAAGENRADPGGDRQGQLGPKIASQGRTVPRRKRRRKRRKIRTAGRRTTSSRSSSSFELRAPETLRRLTGSRLSRTVWVSRRTRSGLRSTPTRAEQPWRAARSQRAIEIDG
ncbi:unnamed protein product, partial [Prorocentrum cordatum]